MFIPDDYIRRTSSTIPFGYELDADFEGYLKPIVEEIQILKEVAEAVAHALSDDSGELVIFADEDNVIYHKKLRDGGCIDSSTELNITLG